MYQPLGTSSRQSQGFLKERETLSCILSSLDAEDLYQE